jgi:hypothetical protein
MRLRLFGKDKLYRLESGKYAPTIPASNRVNTNLLIDLHPSAGMALIIPAGTSTGDTLDGESDAIPTNVTVSAFT